MTPPRWRFLSRRSSPASTPTCRSPTSSPWTSSSANRLSTRASTQLCCSPSRGSRCCWPGLACSECCPTSSPSARLEIGIRIALGAQREQVMRLMLRDGLRPAVIGLVLGLVASVGLTRLIRSMLYGTTALDPVVFAVVSIMLLAVAAVACAVPAWRASRLDPITALRME